ncbi:MAG: hypothetical protein HYU66_02950 [Armatimonadetes bacterium]|nr:hypothetical protein [Armatimonadota bacterium]
MALQAPAWRVTCLRTHEPVGESGFPVPFGQNALRLTSDVPVLCQIGPSDVRQEKLAYDTAIGYAG